MSVVAVVATASLFVRQPSAQTESKRNAPLIVGSPASDRHCRFGNNRLYARHVDRSALSDGGELNNRRQNLDGERQGKLTSSQESANANRNRLAQPSLVLSVNEEMNDVNFMALPSSGVERSRKTD